MGGGGKTQTSTNQVSIPPEVLARYNSVNATAQTAAATPFQQYSTNPNAFVAPLTATQQAGVANTNSAAGQAQPFIGQAYGTLGQAQASADPYYGAATGLAAASASPINAAPVNNQDIGKYLSPYLETVLKGTGAELMQNNAEQQQGALGDAIMSGSFGGDRAGIGAANLENQQNLANSQIYSGILNQGYDTALSTAQQQQGVNLGAGQANRAALSSAAEQLGGLGQAVYGTGAATSAAQAGLGEAAQNASLQGAQAQLAAGQVGQQTQQAGLTALYNQFLQQQSYPFQTAQFLANIAEGTGALSGSTTTSQQPGGFFSDKRLKEDIKPIGKSYDGQTLYRYRYKDDPHNVTRIGLIAQEVAKKHPEAVGEHMGFKTVDYGKATGEAAERGHFAFGGQPTLPGPYAGIDLGALLGAQENMYAPYAGAGLYGAASNGAPHGGSSYVPPATLPVSHLAVANSMPRPPPSVGQTVQDWTNLARLSEQAKNGLGAAMHPTNDNNASYFDPAATMSDADAAALPSKRGGRIKRYASGGGLGAAYADGGDTEDAIPYPDAGMGLDIPNEQNKNQLAVAGAPPGSSGNGIGQIGQIAGGLGTLASGVAKILPFMGLKTGGRAGFAGGGPPIDGYSDDPLADAATFMSNPVRGLAGAFGLGDLAAPTNAPSDGSPFYNYQRTNNGPEALAALAGAPGGITDTTALPGPKPVTVADIAAALGPRTPAHVSPHPDGGINVTPHMPTDWDQRGGLSNATSGAAYSASPGAGTGDPMAGAGLSAADLNTGPLNPATSSASPGDLSTVNATGLGAAGAGLPGKVTPDRASPGGGGLGNVGQEVTGAFDKAGNWIAPKGGFLDQLGHGSQSAIIPLLAGIGAMGTAPTRSLGVALAAGLGSGANAYMNTQQQAANIARTQAEAQLQGASAQRVQAATKTANLDISKTLMFRELQGLIQKDPNGDIVDPGTGTRYSETQKGKTTEAVGQSGAPPADSQGFKYIGPAGQQALATSQKQFIRDASGEMGMGANPDAVAQSGHLISAVNLGASAARTDLTNLNEQATANLSDKAGPLKSGALVPVFQPFVERWNSLMQDAGLPNAMLDQRGLGDTEIAHKMQIGQATAMATAAGQASLGALTDYAGASASPVLTRHATATLLAQQAVNATRAIDQQNYLGEAKDHAPMGNFEAQDLLKAFGNEPGHTPVDYNTMRDHASAIYEGPAWSKVSAALAKPGSDAYINQVKSLDAYGQQHGIQHFSRVFTGVQ